MSEFGDGRYSVRAPQPTMRARLESLRDAYQQGLNPPDTQPGTAPPPARTSSGRATAATRPPSTRAAEQAARAGQYSWRDRIAPELPPVLQAITGITSRRQPVRTQLTAAEPDIQTVPPDDRSRLRQITDAAGFTRPETPEEAARRIELNQRIENQRNADRNAERVNIVRLFNGIRGEFRPIDPANHPYTVDENQIPNQIPNLNDYINPNHPFFIFDEPGPQNPNNWDWHASPIVVPFAYEDANASILENRTNPRFRDAEDRVTGGDSGIVALCASAARTPEAQTKLFTVVSTAVIRMHMENPNLFIDFFNAQRTPQLGDINLTSANLFRDHDLSRPPTERFFAYDESTNPPTIDVNATAAQLRPRLGEVLAALTRGEISLDDIHIIEIVSHAADVGKMIDDMNRPTRIIRELNGLTDDELREIIAQGGQSN